MKRLLFILLAVSLSLSLSACDKAAETPPNDEWFEEEWDLWGEDYESDIEDIGVESLYLGSYALPNPQALMENCELVVMKDDDGWEQWWVVTENPLESAKAYLMELIMSFEYKAIQTPLKYVSLGDPVICVARPISEGALVISAWPAVIDVIELPRDYGETEIKVIQMEEKSENTGVDAYRLHVVAEKNLNEGPRTLGGDMLEITGALEIVYDNFLFKYFDRVPYPLGEGVEPGQAFVCSVNFLGDHEFSRVRITYYDANKEKLGAEESVLMPFNKESYKLSVWTQENTVVPKYVSILLIE